MGGPTRRVVSWLLVAVCAVIIVGYQVLRPETAEPKPRVFVPSAEFYEKLPEGWQVTLADAYWLYLIQYYGERVESSVALDSLPELLDLITTLRPSWERPYLFGSYALLDHGRPDLSYLLLKRGFEENPDEWRIPFNLGVFSYWFGDDMFPAGTDKDEVAAGWFEKAAAIPGSSPILPRLAAKLYEKGDNSAAELVMWAETYETSDDYAREEAVARLDALLPVDPQARGRALAELRPLLSAENFEQLVRDLGGEIR
jgi:tetratricopeptide (TPR) repeat protein